MAQHLAGGIAAQTCRCHTTPCRAQADSDKEFNNSATPWLVASQHGHADVTQLLCGAQADIDKEFNDGATDIEKEFDDGATPSLVASPRGHADVAQLLCEVRADIDE